MSPERDDQILDDGRQRYLRSPDTNGDYALRDQFALAVFSELSCVVKPLIIEIYDCHRDQYGIPQSEDEPAPVVRILKDPRADGRAVLRPHWSDPPSPILVPELDVETLRQHLAEQRPAPPGLRFDWRYLYVIAAAMRSLTPREELHFSNLSRAIAPLETDWFAGPIGHEGWENTRPVSIHMFSEEVDIELTTSVHWPPWWNAETPEGKLFNQALDNLVARGWREPRPNR